MPKTTKATIEQPRMIWTTRNNPFGLGKTIDYVGCVLDCNGPFNLGKGFKGWVATAPNGKKFVAEHETGAIVGNDLELVKTDVANASKQTIMEQLGEALKNLPRVQILSTDQFWSGLHCN